MVLFGTSKVASLDRDDGGAVSVAERGEQSARIAITPDDMVWYADYSRGFLGRLNPATGEVKWPSPSGPQSQPCGITTIKGIVCARVGIRPNTLVRFDPATGTFRPGRFRPAASSCATHDGDEGRQSGARLQRRESCGGGRGEVSRLSRLSTATVFRVAPAIAPEAAGPSCEARRRFPTGRASGSPCTASCPSAPTVPAALADG